MRGITWEGRSDRSERDRRHLAAPGGRERAALSHRASRIREVQPMDEHLRLFPQMQNLEI